MRWIGIIDAKTAGEAVGLQWITQWELMIEVGRTIIEVMNTMRDASAATTTAVAKIFGAEVPEFQPTSRTFEGVEKISKKVGGFLSDIPLIGGFFSGRATGGPVGAGKPFMVGERGPELFIPNNNGKITPNNKLGGVTINVQGNFVGSEREAMRLGDIITKRLGLSTAMV